VKYGKGSDIDKSIASYDSSGVLPYEREKNLKHLPNRTDSMCFGCIPANPTGLRLEFFTDGESIFSWVKVPAHLCGWENLVHGGIISTILDEVMGRTVVNEMPRHDQVHDG
jgi:hypothetical protein